MAGRRPWVKTRVVRERRRRLQIIHGRWRICPRLETLHCTISEARPEWTVKKRSRFATEPHNLKPGRFRPGGPFCFQISKFSVDWPHAARLAWIIQVQPGALESAMLSLRYAAPAPELREFISTYYLFRADLSDIADSTRADLPQIRFMLSGSGHYNFGDGSKAKCPDAMVTGQTTSATRTPAKGPRVVFGLGLLPAGWNAIHGGRAGEINELA